MSLVNFTDPSLEQLRGILGSYGNEQVGRLVKSTPTYVESRWFKVTEEVTETTLNPDGSTNDEKEYKASEVLVDGTIVANGVWFDSDATNSNDPEDPIYFDNLKINSELFTGAVEVGKAYQVEFIAPRSYEEETQYYIVPKGGGGGGLYRLLFNGGASLGYNAPINGVADIIDNLDEVIEEDVTIIQRKFSQATIYPNEIMLAEKSLSVNGNVVYDISVDMSGVGVGEWIE